jgi:hypothetical protein
MDPALLLDAIQECDEDDADEEEDVADFAADAADIPQCFSHFTYDATNGKKLVCDVQGVWNPIDGFTLTDPVVHYVSAHGRRHLNGATDKGQAGIERFFETHECGAACRRMGLRKPTFSERLSFSNPGPSLAAPLDSATARCASLFATKYEI